MLSIRNVEVIYQNVIRILHGVSLEVRDKGISTLLGANGAGKTTILKAIAGLLSIEEGKITEGGIEWNGERIDKCSAQEIARKGIMGVMENRPVLEHLTVWENIIIGAHLRSDRAGIKRDLDLVFDYFPILKHLLNKTSGYISGGEQQMLLVARAIMARPKLMLLDEPSLGLAPILVREIFDIAKRINVEEKTSILLVEQNALAALTIAEYGYVLENGRIVLDGPAEDLRDNEDIKEFYLGLSEVGQRKSYRTVKHYKRRKRWLG
jgi:branched-chain amino acid transport system ATP-binding protein